MTIKSKEEIAVLREGGKILANILEETLKMVKPGITTLELEEFANSKILKAGGRPAFKHHPMGGDLYFPSALCTSINEEIVHGPAVPARELKNGDIISLDVGMEWPFQGQHERIVNPHSLGGGYYTDMSKTIAVGKISKEAKKLIAVTKDCLSAGINAAKVGNTINDIGKAVETVAKKYGYGVVKDLVGHGVGHEVHEKPDIFNYSIGDSHPLNFKLEKGMVIAIEPMITLGTYKIKEGQDGFSYITKDSKLSAHFEHSLAITDSDPLIITNL
ncbi:type I methionyl aminopeptidase [Patescibacteria group bacterium]|nr:type I methionyl aminopeptidase [Patescibacteria group bacterium]